MIFYSRAIIARYLKMDNISGNLEKKIQAIILVIDQEIDICNQEIEKKPALNIPNSITHYPNSCTVKSARPCFEQYLDPASFYYAWREQYDFIKSLLQNHQFSSIALLIAGGRIKFGEESRSLAIPVREKIAVITCDLLAAVKPVVAESELLPKSIRRRM